MKMKNSDKLVLIVEDNALNMRLFRELLGTHDYNILQARGGKQGWELAREHHPDLILMDIQLPDVSGLEVTRWLKSDKDLKSIPVIAVTSFAMKGDEGKMLRNGCDAYVSKPFRPRELLAKVREYL